MHAEVDAPSAGRRAARTAATTAALTARARAWTWDRGLGGYTVDELCASVGVSRRTFFNHFATKEDAVLGVPAHLQTAEAEARFLAGGESASGALSPSLPEDLAELMLARWEACGFDDHLAPDALLLLESMPRLLTRAIHLTVEQERRDADLVARREHLAPGDPRASTVAHLVGSLLRSAMRVGGEASPGGLRTELLARLHIARETFGGSGGGGGRGVHKE